jgi:hypothetical protein
MMMRIIAVKLFHLSVSGSSFRHNHKAESESEVTLASVGELQPINEAALMHQPLLEIDP